MTVNTSRADLAVLTWPTLAWFTAWQVMTAAPVAAASSQSVRKPARKPARKRRPRRRAATNIIQFPLERAARRPAVVHAGTAEIIPLSEIA